MITEYPHFFTATILEWKKLLAPVKYKEVIIESMRFLVADKRIIIYGFVIMVNHIHAIWQMKAGIKRENLQRDFLKFTEQKIEKDLKRCHPKVLSHFLVNAADRRYQFWERNALSIEIWSEKVLEPKLNYIHENPLRAGLCRAPGQYKYSSALFYETGIDNWGFLTHYRC
jgi:putative transposase